MLALLWAHGPAGASLAPAAKHRLTCFALQQVCVSVSVRE
jgi:hypothetical protein